MINFPFGTNGKFIILGVPILKHITVSSVLLFELCLKDFQESQSGKNVGKNLGNFMPGPGNLEKQGEVRKLIAVAVSEIKLEVRMTE